MDIDKLFDISAERRNAVGREIYLLPTFDTHIHCRPCETGQMQMVVRECLKAHAGIVDIANVHGIVSPERVTMRRDQILSCVPNGRAFEVMVVPLINNNSDGKLWGKAYQNGLIPGIKVFWQGVSNDYGNSISRADALSNFLREAARYERRSDGKGMLVTLHAECLKDYSGNVIPIKDREYWCMQNEVRTLVDIGGTHLRYVVRHVSDYRTLDIVTDLRRQGFDIHVEFSPQYFMHTEDSIFTGDDGHAALVCDCVYWPRPKGVESRSALRDAALVGHDWMHLGQDYAMHLNDPTQNSGVKINRNGIAVGGLNLLPEVAKSLMIDFFAANGKLEVYERLTSINPARLYGFTEPKEREKYVRYDWTVEEFIYGKRESGEAVNARCYLAGAVMHWKRSVND